MPAQLFAYGGLFLWSLLAATVLPLGSEAPLAALVHAERRIWAPVAVATAGNYLGACTTYWLGRRVAAARQPAAQGSSRSARMSLALLRRYGRPALLLSWVPLLGDTLVALAGFLGIPFRTFSLWVVLGKGLRYLAVAWAAASLL